MINSPQVIDLLLTSYKRRSLDIPRIDIWRSHMTLRYAVFNQ